MEEKNSEKKERKMRDSGIPWIGEVPEGWEFSKIKYHCTMKSGDNITALDISDNGEYPVYGGNGLRGFYKIYNKNGNHILIGRQGALAGNVHLVNGKFWATDHAVIVTLKNDVFINYFFRMLESMNLNQYAFDTAAQPGLSVSRIMNLNIVLPNLKEQHRIADFLDSKCSEIDTLIENLRVRMESAKEYKKAVITEAVTKGLNKDAKMKDSGVEWIGEIPEHWEMRRIKNIGVYRNGLTYSPSDMVDENDGKLVLRSSNIQNGKLSFDNNVYVKTKIPKLLQIKRNDILICSRNGSKELVGKSALINEDINATFGAFMMILRCECAKYMYYILNSSLLSFYIGSFATSTINQLTGGNFGNMKFPFTADTKEQQYIADYLDSKCSEIDTILQNYETQIATLEEYKKSLIYEYVTGKKEVPAA